MVYIILGKGFEEIEAIAPGDILRRGGVSVSFISADVEKTVEGAHGINLSADQCVSEVIPEDGDTVLIPGGMGGVESILASKATMDFIRSAFDKGALLSAICAGPAVFARLGLLEGKNITCYPGCEDMMAGAICQTDKSVVECKGLITARAPGSAVEFGLSLLAYIAGEEKAKAVRSELVI
jgi:4-methyl-5(b-hydroxyethyl)-thiazole monophosphate biosynthesis